MVPPGTAARPAIRVCKGETPYHHLDSPHAFHSPRQTSPNRKDHRCWLLSATRGANPEHEIWRSGAIMAQAAGIVPEGKTRSASHEDSVWSIVWTAQDQILTASVDETVKLWTPELELVRTFAGHRLGAISVAASSTELEAVSSSIDCYLRFWDLNSGAQKSEINAGAVECWTVAWSPTAALVASGSQRGAVNVWNLGDRTSPPVKASLGTGSKSRFIFSVAFSPDGERVAAGGSDGEVHVFDLKSGALVAALQGHTKPVRSLAFTSNGAALITGSDDQRINVYEMSRNALVSTYDGHASWVLGIAASPDARHFASCGADKRVKVWDLAMKECLHTLDRHNDAVWDVCFSPNDPNLLATGADDGSVHVFNIAQHIT